jgi:hypothetical protein
MALRPMIVPGFLDIGLDPLPLLELALVVQSSRNGTG